jgi:hypothetical protein
MPMLSRSAFQCQRPGAISSTAGAYRDSQRIQSPAFTTRKAERTIVRIAQTLANVGPLVSWR